MPPKQKSPNQKSPKTMASPDIEPTSEGALTVEAVRRRYRIAEEKRSRWTRLWNDCYAYTLPSQNGDGDGQSATSVSNDALFDGTAPDAVDCPSSEHLAQLAA